MKIDELMNDVRGVLRVIEPALAVIAIAQAATGIGGQSADQAIKAIRAALKSFEDVAEGKVTRDQALAALAALRAGIVANDAAADAALSEKFGGE